MRALALSSTPMGPCAFIGRSWAVLIRGREGQQCGQSGPRRGTSCHLRPSNTPKPPHWRLALQIIQKICIDLRRPPPPPFYCGPVSFEQEDPGNGLWVVDAAHISLRRPSETVWAAGLSHRFVHACALVLVVQRTSWEFTNRRFMTVHDNRLVFSGIEVVSLLWTANPVLWPVGRQQQQEEKEEEDKEEEEKEKRPWARERAACLEGENTTAYQVWTTSLPVGRQSVLVTMLSVRRHRLQTVPLNSKLWPHRAGGNGLTNICDPLTQNLIISTVENVPSGWADFKVIRVYEILHSAHSAVSCEAIRWITHFQSQLKVCLFSPEYPPSS